MPSYVKLCTVGTNKTVAVEGVNETQSLANFKSRLQQHRRLKLMVSLVFWVSVKGEVRVEFSTPFLF